MRLCTFNVENLFSRPVVFNMRDQERARQIMKMVSDFTELMSLPSYRDDKAEIERLWRELKDYIFINLRSSTVGRYLFVKGELLPDGRGDWDGFIDLKRKRFDERQIKNTGKVIKEVDADIQCLVEVESAQTLQRFNTDILNSRFPDRIVIDGNDPRGIDIGLASKRDFPILTARTNIFAEDQHGTIFSRDCLEVEVDVGRGQSLFVLVNHFKAKDRKPWKSDAKRKRQSTEVSRILRERYDLSRDWVVVAGDLNDEPDSDPITPLIETPGLNNVLEVAQIPEENRWTYFYGAKKSYNSIDYIFASDPVAPRIQKAGLERRGMHNVAALTGGAIQPFSNVTSWRNAASDHAAVWVDIDVS
ncbi:MAG TPA: endonuclease/exonuclease/phosphatase family protein [Rhodobacterales bacterium]|nr:endonuclease/exonuclease/phosphatase family protein [Rhodobacterales bacterium]